MADKVQFIVQAVDQASPTLKKIDNSVKSLTDNSVSSFGKMKESLSKNTAGLAALGVGAGLALNSIAGSLGSSVDAFAEYEATISGLKAVLAPTSDEFKKLGDLARKLGSETQFTSKSSADAMEMLAKNGLNSQQILNGAIESTLSLASSTGATLASAADITSSAMLVFGKQTKDLGQIVNSITGTTNLSKFGIEDYASALAQGGGAAAAFGVSLTDFNASIAAISPSFQSGSDAGTSFKTFLQRLVPASDPAMDAMMKLGIVTEEGQNQFFDASGKMQSMANISEVLKKALVGVSDEQKISSLSTIFGSDALRAASAMAGVGAGAFTTLSKAIEGTSAMDNAATRMKNYKGDMERFKGTINELQLTIGSILAPVLSSVVNALGPVITMFSNFAKGNPAITQGLIILTGTVLALIVALTALGIITPLVGGALKSIGASLGVMSLPILALIAVVTALGVAYSTNFMGIKDKTDEVFKFLSTFIPETWETISNSLSETWTTIRTMFESTLNSLKSTWETIWGGIKSFLEGVLAGIGIVLGLTFQLITGDFEGFLNNLSAVWSLIWNGMKNTLYSIWEGISIGAKTAWTLLSTVLSGIWSGIKFTSDLVWNGIKTVVLGIISTIGLFFSGEGRTTLYNSFTGMFTGLGDFVSGVFDGIVNGIKSAINVAIDLINSAIRSANNVPGVNFSTLDPLQARAKGGPVSSGTPYMVGELGPELFIPSSNGSIVPNNKLVSSSGGSQTNQISINMGGITVANKQDADYLASQVIEKITRQMQLYKLGIS